MFPFIRTALTILRARKRPPLEIDGTSMLELRVGFNDVDVIGELNNARHLSMMELGRWDYSQRVGFIALMRARRWAVVVGGASSGLIAAPEVLDAMGVEPDWGSDVPEWVAAWIEAEGQRPWLE